MLKKFLPTIIASLFLVGFVAYAWTGPGGPPPAGNVDAPLNVGTTTQLKSGALGISGVLRGYADAIFDGNISVGTTTIIKNDGSISTNLNAEKLGGYTQDQLPGFRGYVTLNYNNYGGMGSQFCNFKTCSFLSPGQCLVNPNGVYIFGSWQPAYYAGCDSGYTPFIMRDVYGSVANCGAGSYVIQRTYTCLRQ